MSSEGIMLSPTMYECHRGKHGISEESIRDIIFYCLLEEQVDFEKVPLACGLTTPYVVKITEWNGDNSDLF